MTVNPTMFVENDDEGVKGSLSCKSYVNSQFKIAMTG